MMKEKLIEELREGEVRKGRVSSICDFGAFVDIGGADGLVHLSELSWSRVRHPSEVLKIGQEVDVYVLGINAQEKKIALSIKRTQAEPWSQVAAELRGRPAGARHGDPARQLRRVRSHRRWHRRPDPRFRADRRSGSRIRSRSCTRARSSCSASSASIRSAAAWA